MSGSKLLILACSATKQIRSSSIHSDRALHLYDGPAYRIARKYVGRNKPRTVILSAEHGLIDENDRLKLYDRKMDDARASELAITGYDQAVNEIYRLGSYREVFVFGGARYRLVIATWVGAGLFRGASITYSGGGIGQQLHQLKAFLDDCAAAGAEVGDAA